MDNLYYIADNAGDALVLRGLVFHQQPSSVKRTSHAGTVVPECFKDDDASQWKSGKFDPRSLKNPRTDRHLNLHG